MLDIGLYRYLATYEYHVVSLSYSQLMSAVDTLEKTFVSKNN